MENKKKLLAQFELFSAKIEPRESTLWTITFKVS